MQSRFFQFAVFIALLIGALLFFRDRDSHPEKPSDLPNFSEGNHPIKKGLNEKIQVVEKKLPELTPDEMTPSVQVKLEKLQVILKSKNDNDPFLDEEFRKMSPELKSALRQIYIQTPIELRNDRGTIVFLLARDIQSAEDLAFLKQVLTENPCLSLADCSSAKQEDPHFSSVNQMTMNYPQMTALYQLDQQLQFRPSLLKDTNFLDTAKDVIRQAENFPVPMVQKKAHEIKLKYRF